MKIVFPQKHLVEGNPPFNLRFKNDPERLHVWLVSTKIALPDVIYKEDVPLYPFYWDSPELPEWTPRFEFLIGKGKHGAIHKEWGTQPLNTYLRGHFCLKPHPRAHAEGEFVLVQQYFKSGWWGTGDRTIITEQIRQNTVGLQLLWKLGILKAGVNVEFFDQSKPTQEWHADPFRLFKAENLSDAYYKWLPKYFREWRGHDFKLSIEDVIKKYLKCSN